MAGSLLRAWCLEIGASLELGCWCLELSTLLQLIVNPPVSVYVGPGLVKVTTTFCAPVGAFEGIVNVARTVPWVASEILVPTMVPARVTLVIGALAGGQGGVV